MDLSEFTNQLSNLLIGKQVASPYQFIKPDEMVLSVLIHEGKDSNVYPIYVNTNYHHLYLGLVSSSTTGFGFNSNNNLIIYDTSGINSTVYNYKFYGETDFSEKNLSDVKSKTKLPEGTFTKKAESIKRTILKYAKNKNHAKRMISFYINRAGKGLKNKTEIMKAKQMIENCHDFSVLTNKLKSIDFNAKEILDVEKSDELSKLLIGKTILAYPTDFGCILSVEVVYSGIGSTTRNQIMTIFTNTDKFDKFQIFHTTSLNTKGKLLGFSLDKDHLIIHFENETFTSNLKYK